MLSKPVMDLFEFQGSKSSMEGVPLAEKMRPQTLEEFVGHSNIVGVKSPFMQSLLKHNKISNTVLWGPPGTGKTSFALLLSKHFKAHFHHLNAMDAGAKRIREIGQEAHRRKVQFLERTLVFIDEVHRLNKAQQDVLLPFTEKMDFILIGATTENPSYELNAALLSRVKVLRLEKHTRETLLSLAQKACVVKGCTLDEILERDAQRALADYANGDGRLLFNTLELLMQDQCTEDLKQHPPLSASGMLKIFGERPVSYDKNGDEHYDTISAFIKSVRGSDPDAAIYYLARMLAGGESPEFIARRLVILASEDIGNADPHGLVLAVACQEATKSLGMPEARIPLAQATIYLSLSPKSNRAYLAIDAALAEVKVSGNLAIPLAIRSSRTEVSKSLGYGQGYRYPCEEAKGWLPQNYFPEALGVRKFYESSGHGFEKRMDEYQSWLKSHIKSGKKGL